MNLKKLYRQLKEEFLKENWIDLNICDSKKILINALALLFLISLFSTSVYAQGSLPDTKTKQEKLQAVLKNITSTYREDAIKLPVKEIRTKLGILKTYGEAHPANILWLDDKELISAQAVRFETTYEEENGLASIIVAHIEYNGDTQFDIIEFGKYHIIDMTGTEPFITKEYLPISDISIKKETHNIYILSGTSRTEKDKNGNYLLVKYTYNSRKQRLVRVE